MWQDLLCRGSRLVGWALYEKLDNVQSLLSSWVDDDSFNSTSPAVTAAMVRTLHHTHTRLTALVRDYPGESVAER